MLGCRWMKYDAARLAELALVHQQVRRIRVQLHVIQIQGDGLTYAQAGACQKPDQRMHGEFAQWREPMVTMELRDRADESCDLLVGEQIRCAAPEQRPEDVIRNPSSRLKDAHLSEKSANS